MEDQKIPSASSDPTKIPTPEEFLLEGSLYVPYEVTSANYSDALTIEFFQGPLDAYCSQCEKESVFHSAHPLPYYTRGGGIVQPDNIDELLKSAEGAPLPSEESEHWQWNNTRSGMV